MVRHCASCNAPLGEDEQCYQCGGAMAQRGSSNKTALAIGALVIFLIIAGRYYMESYYSAKPLLTALIGEVWEYVADTINTASGEDALFGAKLRIIFIGVFLGTFGFFFITILLRWMDKAR